MPIPHSQDEIDDFKEVIAKIVDIEETSRSASVSLKGPISSNVATEIRQFIQNEQVLCALDNSYWEARYAYVCNEKGEISKFRNRKSQEVFDQIVGDFDERQVSIEVLCLDPNAKILTADLKWKRLDDIQIGEELVAVDEGQSMNERRAEAAKRQRELRSGVHRGKSTKRLRKERKMRTTIVENKWESCKEALKFTFEDGRTLICSADHQWLCKQRGGCEPIWQKSEEMRVGDQARYITKPWNEQTTADAWMGGIIDGEGSLDSGCGIEINITQVFNVVFDRVKEYLSISGYNFQQGIDKRQPSKDGRGKLGSKDVGRLYVSRMDEAFRIIGQTRPFRFISKKWWEGKSLPGKKTGIGWSRIVKIEILPKQRMIDIQTSTRTFIAEGFVSHNCLKGRQVGITTKTALKFMHRLMFIPHTQAVMASVQAEKSELIGRILDIAYTKSPWWLVPMRGSKGRFDNGSVLSIQSGMQATGIAQGWTPTCLPYFSKIRMANGFLKAISEVSVGERVLTHQGKIATVKKAFETKPFAQTKVLRLWGHYSPLECTIEHRVSTPDGFVEADQISVGDYVCHPLREIKHSLLKAQFTHFSRGKIAANKAHNFDAPFDLPFGYLCGLYLAEGSLHKSGIGKKKPYLSEVIFTVHEREAEDRVQMLRRFLGKEQHIKVKKHNEHGAQIKISAAWLARWISENFGEKTNKQIPDWIWDAGEEFCRGILYGYLDGDGHCDTSSNNVVAPTICSQIAYQMRDLVASLKYGWASIYFVDEHRQGSMKKRPVWRLVLSGPVGAGYRRDRGLPFRKPMKHARHWRYGVDGKTVDVMIESISHNSSASLWDLEVDSEDHSFTTDQCAVHNCVHISELADIPKPEKVIEEGLLRATHSSRNLFLVLEGTGGGNTGWLAETWRNAKRDYPLGKHRLCPIFLPWFTATDLYPEADWIRKFPIPGNFMRERLDATVKHVARCEAFVRNTPYMRKVYGAGWTMPIDQQWFYDFNYRQAVNNRTQRVWMAQMPADDFEALTGKHDSVFEADVIEDLESNIYEIITNRATGEETKLRKQPVDAYAITGHDVDPSFYPSKDQIDFSKPPINVYWNSSRGQEYEWQMVPLIWLPEENEENTMDRLLIFEHPAKWNEYTLGIDTADGLGKEDEERTVLSLAKNRYHGGYDEQVAEFTSNRVNAAQAVAFAACIGAYWSPCVQDSRGIMYAIEQIGRPGETCQHQLKMMGFHRHYRPKRFDSKKIKDELGKKEGWWSSAWAVPILMTRYVEAINGGWYVPRSRWLIEELKTLERRQAAGKSKMVHRSGQFDDRVRASAQSFFCAHDLDVLADRAQKRRVVPKQMNEPTPMRRAGQVSVSDGDDDWG